MRPPTIWFRCTLLLAALVAVASAAGVFVPATYARETVSWAAQGRGQDLVNLFIVVPVLVVAALRARQGSLSAHLMWIGALIYAAYSYVLYAFFVHFGPLFPIYVAALGLSVYSLAGAVLSVDAATVRERLGASARVRVAACVLLVVGLGFGALWLGEIVPALLAGTTPRSLADIGFWVNPVHVLDLGIVLPGSVITGVLVLRSRPVGFVFLVPLLVFSALMGLAILAMTLTMRSSGVPAEAPMVLVVSLLVLATGVMARRLMRTLSAAARSAPL